MVTCADVVSMSVISLGSINRMANAFARLDSDRRTSIHYNWIHAELASYIYSAFSANPRERGGRFVLAVGEAGTSLDVMVSIIMATRLKQQTGFLYIDKVHTEDNRRVRTHACMHTYMLSVNHTHYVCMHVRIITHRLSCISICLYTDVYASNYSMHVYTHSLSLSLSLSLSV